MSNSNNCSGNELVIFASVISIFLSKHFNCDELDILGNLFSALGANLSTIAAANSTCCDNDANTDLNANTN